MYYKLIHESGVNRGLPIKEGLLEDLEPFAEKGSCVKGGIYFCRPEHVLYWASQLNYWHAAPVTVPDDAQVVDLGKKLRASKLIIGKVQRLDRDHPLRSELKLCAAAVQQDGEALKFVTEQTPELCLLAVQQNGQALQYVSKQTPELCLLAVQLNGWALQFVRKQTPELCLLTVQRHGWALQYVDEQTPQICLAAVQQNGRALQYVRKQTPKLCMVAVQRDEWALKHVRK